MISKKPFGVTKNGSPVFSYTLENGQISLTVLDYGATLQSLVLQKSSGKTDVVLGYDTIADYERNDGYLGASIGRFAGRIPDAILNIEGSLFPVTANEGCNQLHGGSTGFDKRIWNAETGADFVTFSLISQNNEEGFPGTLLCSITYMLKNNIVTLICRGKSDHVTAWNPTNHAYWNLDGHDAGDTRLQQLEIPADFYIPVGSDMIPVNAETDVSGTRFDFRKLREIGGEYDHSFVLSDGPIRLFGTKGIGMEITTDCKAVQFYNAKFLGDRIGKGDAHYGPFGAVCLETEGRQTQRGGSVYPENILEKNIEKTHITEFRFITKED